MWDWAYWFSFYAGFTPWARAWTAGAFLLSPCPAAWRAGPNPQSPGPPMPRGGPGPPVTDLPPCLGTSQRKTRLRGKERPIIHRRKPKKYGGVSLRITAEGRNTIPPFRGYRQEREYFKKAKSPAPEKAKPAGRSDPDQRHKGGAAGGGEKAGRKGR